MKIENQTPVPSRELTLVPLLAQPLFHNCLSAGGWRESLVSLTKAIKHGKAKIKAHQPISGIPFKANIPDKSIQIDSEVGPCAAHDHAKSITKAGTPSITQAPKTIAASSFNKSGIGLTCYALAYLLLANN